MNTSKPFLDMAERINKIAESDFGGAFVLVAPDGNKIEVLLNNPEQNIVGFWGFIKATIEDKYNETQQNINGAMMPRIGFPRG